MENYIVESFCFIISPAQYTLLLLLGNKGLLKVWEDCSYNYNEKKLSVCLANDHKTQNAYSVIHGLLYDRH